MSRWRWTLLYFNLFTVGMNATLMLMFWKMGRYAEMRAQFWWLGLAVAGTGILLLSWSDKKREGGTPGL